MFSETVLLGKRKTNHTNLTHPFENFCEDFNFLTSLPWDSEDSTLKALAAKEERAPNRGNDGLSIHTHSSSSANMLFQLLELHLQVQRKAFLISV